jgi:ABC-type sulfate transport system substrate-binding protein
MKTKYTIGLLVVTFETLTATPFGGPRSAQQTCLAEGGIFDQIYQPNQP